MTDTINAMDLVFADMLIPNQIMIGDLIKVDEEIMKVISIAENNEGVNLVLLNDFDEKIETFFFDDEKVELYVFLDSEE